MRAVEQGVDLGTDLLGGGCSYRHGRSPSLDDFGRSRRNLRPSSFAPGLGHDLRDQLRVQGEAVPDDYLPHWQELRVVEVGVSPRASRGLRDRPNGRSSVRRVPLAAPAARRSHGTSRRTRARAPSCLRPRWRLRPRQRRGAGVDHRQLPARLDILGISVDGQIQTIHSIANPRQAATS
jgi:hypothetical protein